MNIETGVPIPPVQSARSELGRLVRKMEVGQSMLCEGEEQAQKVRDAMRSARMKASMRKQEDGRYRVWRVA